MRVLLPQVLLHRRHACAPPRRRPSSSQAIEVRGVRRTGARRGGGPPPYAPLWYERRGRTRMTATNDLLAPPTGTSSRRTAAPLVIDRGRAAALGHRGRSSTSTPASPLCALGHAHPALVRAVSEQVARPGHIANYYCERQADRAGRRALPPDRDGPRVFANTGTEANEGALSSPGATTGRATTASGRRSCRPGARSTAASMGLVTMTGQAKYLGLRRAARGVSHVAYGDLEAMRRRVSDRTAARHRRARAGRRGVLRRRRATSRPAPALRRGRAAAGRRDPDGRRADGEVPSRCSTRGWSPTW